MFLFFGEVPSWFAVVLVGRGLVGYEDSAVELEQTRLLPPALPTPPKGFAVRDCWVENEASEVQWVADYCCIL